MSINGPMNGATVLDPERMAPLLAALPTWLPRQRWFADKGRDIISATLTDALVDDVEEDVLILAIVEVAFSSGPDASYFIPLAWTRAPAVDGAIDDVDPVGGDGKFVEATEQAWFGRWLVDALRVGSPAAADAWRFASHAPVHIMLDAAREVPARVMGMEQSNTSIRYGNAAIVKLVRRLQPAPNPDEEMLRALGNASFKRIPQYLGGASWRASDGAWRPIALAQAYVPNQGDGWLWTLAYLRTLSDWASASDVGAGSPEWLLGRRTGEMHAAMARLSGPDLDPALTSRGDVHAEVERIRRSVANTVSLLEEQQASLPASLRVSLPKIGAGLIDATSDADALIGEVNTWRIRVHGDFHLGQTLRTVDDDWAIIDFEGEPARPVAERRQKTSALKDVAGMLRSFSYARGAAVRAGGNPAALQRWETSARQAFLIGYRDAVREAPVPLVPADNDAFFAALAAWELDKALYEAAYEVRNRPDWIELPLRSLLPNL